MSPFPILHYFDTEVRKSDGDILFFIYILDIHWNERQSFLFIDYSYIVVLEYHISNLFALSLDESFFLLF